jgi:3-hydroxyisobutyrate dehydrogenase
MKLEKKDLKIGFIGLGVMGKSMAGHLLKDGYALYVYNRTPGKAEELVSNGAIWIDSPAEIAKQCNCIITIVGYPKDVEEVYFGEHGLIQHAATNSVLIDMTTSDPSMAQRIHAEAKEKNIYSLDAPVSGGDVGAREARLSIMVGGDNEVFEAVLPIFNVMGNNINYLGKAGSGQHTKMANQIAIASGMLGITEAMIYAQKSGLDPEQVIHSIENGAAGSWSLSNLAPRMIKGNFDPGFYVKHFIKDMKIAIDSAEKLSVDMPGLNLAKSLYDRLVNEGGANLGTQSLFKLYDKNSN